MPQVNVTAAATVTVAESTRRSGKVHGSAVNRGPNSAWVEITEPATAVVPGAGAGQGAELKMGEATDFVLGPGEALRARCAAAETARLDVLSSDVE